MQLMSAPDKESEDDGPLQSDHGIDLTLDCFEVEMS
jgi:hypothetical protein